MSTLKPINLIGVPFLYISFNISFAVLYISFVLDVGAGNFFWCDVSIKFFVLNCTFITFAYIFSFLSLYPTWSAILNKISSNFSISDMSCGSVIEFPIPFGFSGLYFTSELSMPLAYSHIIIPCLPNFFASISLFDFAKSPIVFICILYNLGTVLLPNMNSSDTGKFHIFVGISSSHNVCTLSGFVKSDAILASNLLCATPTFTVNPSSSFTLLFISFPLFNNVSFIR